MLSIVTGTFRLFAMRWPALIAIFLAGWVINFVLIRFSGVLGNIEPLFGMLVLPIAVLARLASYVAMFLVLRPAMPTFMTLSEAKLAATTGPPQRFSQILGSSILAFFIVFATWNMMRDDMIAYANAYLESWNPFDTTGSSQRTAVFTLDPSVMTVSVVAVAFILRFLIKRFSDRIPTWTSYVAVYLEAVWVFIAVFVIQNMLSVIPAWLSTRTIVVWGADVLQTAREAFAPLGWVLDAIVWLVEQGGLLIVLPLAWLALAGIVYSNALALERTTPAGGRVVQKAKGSYERVPAYLRKRIVSLSGELIERWRPIADSARLIWSAGIVAVALFILSYAVLDTSSLWILQGIYRILGPHELAWWFAVDNQIGLVTDAIVEPLRLCLIAATYDYCLRIMRDRQLLDLPDATAPVVAAAAADASEAERQ